MKTSRVLHCGLFAGMFLCLVSSAPAQDFYVQRGADRFPVRELPDGGKSVVIDGRTYFLVSKEDLAALTAESEILRASATRDDTLVARHKALLATYARYQEAADTLVGRQDAQILQAERINKSYDELYRELKRLTGLSTWSITGGVGTFTVDSEARLMGSLGVGYQHWLAQYQFGKNFSGVLVGVRVNL